MDLQTPVEREHERLSQSPVKIQSGLSPTESKSGSPIKRLSPIKRDHLSPKKSSDPSALDKADRMDEDDTRGETDPLFDEHVDDKPSSEAKKPASGPTKSATEARPTEEEDLGYLYSVRTFSHWRLVLNSVVVGV